MYGIFAGKKFSVLILLIICEKINSLCHKNICTLTQKNSRNKFLQLKNFKLFVVAESLYYLLKISGIVYNIKNFIYVIIANILQIKEAINR